MISLKIAMLTLHLPQVGENSGVDYQVHYLSNKLTSFGHRVTVFSLTSKPEDALYKTKMIVLPTSVKRKIYLRAFIYPVYLRLQEYRDFDIIHSHGNDFLFFFSPKPLIRTFYGTALLESIYASSIYRKLYQIMWYPLEFVSGFNAKYSTTISKSTKKYLSFVNEIIPCGVNLSMFFPSCEKSSNPSILFIGTMGGRKRGKLLFSIFLKKIIKEVPNAELWLVSDKPCVGKNVKYFGRVSTSKLIKLYRKAWVLCSLSSYEGFGVPYIEAMACGTPIVTTPNQGVMEVLQKGEYGFIVSDKNLPFTLIKLLKDSDIRAKMAKMGLEYVRKYSIDKIAKQYEQIYCKMVGKRAL